MSAKDSIALMVQFGIYTIALTTLIITITKKK